jgi:hypothetical protein
LRLFWGDLKCGVQLGRSPVLNIDRAARRIPISETRFRKEYRLEYTSIGQLRLNIETFQLPSSESADGSSFSMRPFFRSSAMSKSRTKIHMHLVNVTQSFSAELHDDRRRAAVKLDLCRLPSSVCKGLHACQFRQSANYSPLRSVNEVGGVQVALPLLSLSLCFDFPPFLLCLSIFLVPAFLTLFYSSNTKINGMGWANYLTRKRRKYKQRGKSLT